MLEEGTTHATVRLPDVSSATLAVLRAYFECEWTEDLAKALVAADNEAFNNTVNACIRYDMPTIVTKLIARTLPLLTGSAIHLAFVTASKVQ